MSDIKLNINLPEVWNVENSKQYTNLSMSKGFGYWRLGGSRGLSIMSPTKPNWLHIKMMKLLLGIEWVEKEDVLWK